MNAPIRRLLVGEAADPHLATILRSLPAQGTVVIDASTIAQSLVSFDLGTVLFTDVAGATVELSDHCQVRAWARRIAPPGWTDGIVLGGRAAASAAAGLALLWGVLRHPSIEWLTGPETLFRAEDKLLQLMQVRSFGFLTPDTVWRGSPTALAAQLGEPFVLKPLGPGAYRAEDGEQRVVYSRAVRADDLLDVDLLASPFIAQELLNAKTHLRVATVREEAWVCTLDARGLPLDWRRDRGAHDGFVPTASEPHLMAAALAVARGMGCGYSSQDWVQDEDNTYFLDLNPAGQWLFLPEPVSSSVTQAILTWLTTT